MAQITVQDLLEAGVHFGHQTKRWNPKMKPYIFGARNGIHIFNLGQTMVCLNEACKFLYKTVAQGGEVLFVGTKRQAQELVRDTATRDKMHYITHRWLGGTLTNLPTIRQSISKFNKLQKMEEDGVLDKMKKKQSSRLRREMNKLGRQLSGILEMRKIPSVMVVVDIVKEHIAIKEANTLGIPVVAILDSNCNPDLVDYGVPGNDDAVRSLKIIIDQLSEAVHAGKGIADKKAAEKAAAQAKEEAERKEAKKKEREAKAKARKEAEAAKAKKEAEKAEEPKAEEKAEKKPAAKKPAAKKAKAEPKAEEKAEEPKAEEKAEEPKAEEKAEEPKAEEKAEEPKAEEAKAEEPKAEEPKAEEKA